MSAHTIRRVYVKKKPGFDVEAQTLLGELQSVAGILGLEHLEIYNTYTVEGLDEEAFEKSVETVFLEKSVDDGYDVLPCLDKAEVFGVEFLPGQYDQRADSAEQCIQLITEGVRPTVRSMKVYALYGALQSEEVNRIKKYVINPVEAREASLALPSTLAFHYEKPALPQRLENFCALDDEELEAFRVQNGLAMDHADIVFAREYFRRRGKAPTMTEIKVIDTYWSDHCRHTTFLTCLDDVQFEDARAEAMYAQYQTMRKTLARTQKPVTLMDIATIGAKYLRDIGALKNLDESDEINACSVKVKMKVDGEMQDWLLLFKNETHNHPTEIEPFGGAATCIGGAIRDPLANRGYVYQAMRLSGVGDVCEALEDTLPAKLPQRKIAVTAAGGYSSYGNQIGLATGIVDEIYHPGYTAKHMELGAVLGAVKEDCVRREQPGPGDCVILLGGRTGRDGCGGATGSSKAHTAHSLDTCGAEVQKGNAPEERKLQRLFRNPLATRLIKRCNDFGAGGVSVAIGELADGLVIDLDKVKKKYQGLSATELAISESQERMAVVVERKDAERFIALCRKENLEATVVAQVSEEKEMVMYCEGEEVVRLSRAFLSSNGAAKHHGAVVCAPKALSPLWQGDFAARTKAMLKHLNVAGKQGLSERFDSTIGAGTLTMPFGGKNQKTPIQAMSALLPVLEGETTTCSFMSWGYNPFLSEASAFEGGYLAVVESLTKLRCAGYRGQNVYLTLQEYFERLSDDVSWGKPLGALLGALKAQIDFSCAAIGGKDSMSGSFESMHVPPTLISFAVGCGDAHDVITPEFKKAGSYLYLLSPSYSGNLPDAQSLKARFSYLGELMDEKKVLSCASVGFGGAMEWVFKMAIGNNLGVVLEESLPEDLLFSWRYGSVLIETSSPLNEGILLGRTTQQPCIQKGAVRLSLQELLAVYEGKLESVYALHFPDTPVGKENRLVAAKTAFHARTRACTPRVLIPVFPGTNCEYDTARAFARSGADPQTVLVRNLSSDDVTQSVEDFLSALAQSQIVFLPGGFSAGDEPEGSAKFITSFFRNPKIADALHERLQTTDFLMGGICNGFQALLKLGLLPYGKITAPGEDNATLTFNTIARHQSKLVRTVVCAADSPWLMRVQAGEVYTVPISHGEGRFVAPQTLLESLYANHQIITRYCDENGVVSSACADNPNGSMWAIEGIVSPDGRILGKMGHSERVGEHLYQNVPGRYDMGLFLSAVEYFS